MDRPDHVTCSLWARFGDLVDARLDTARLTARDVAWVQLILAAIAANRAFDYAWERPGSTPMLELAIDAQLWGFLFAFVAYSILVGKAGRLHLVVWAGHVVGAVSYSLLGVSGLIRLAAHPTGPLVSWWPVPLWMLGCAAFFLVTLAATVWARRKERGGGELGFATIVRASLLVTIIGLVTPITPLDGGYAVGPIILAATIHCMIALRMGPVPVGGALDQRIAAEHQQEGGGSG